MKLPIAAAMGIVVRTCHDFALKNGRTISREPLLANSGLVWVLILPTEEAGFGLVVETQLRTVHGGQVVVRGALLTGKFRRIGLFREVTIPSGDYLEEKLPKFLQLVLDHTKDQARKAGVLSNGHSAQKAV